MSNDGDSPRNQGPRVDTPKTVMEIIAQDERSDRRLARIALGLAVIVHASLFAITWPTFAGATSGTKEQRSELIVLKQVKFKKPPPAQEQQIPRPRIRKVQIPDANPEAPEPISEKTTTEDFDFTDEPDLVLGVPQPPPPPEGPGGPVTWEAGGEVTEPVRVGGPDPVYSVAAQMARFTGSVVLECVIGKDGTVESVQVVKPLPFGLTESATEAVRQWRFEPSTLNGKPVAVIYVLTVTFSLPQR